MLASIVLNGPIQVGTVWHGSTVKPNQYVHSVLVHQGTGMVGHEQEEEVLPDMRVQMAER